MSGENLKSEVERFMAAVGNKARRTSNASPEFFQLGYLQSFIGNRLDDNPNLRQAILQRTAKLEEEIAALDKDSAPRSEA